MIAEVLGLVTGDVTSTSELLQIGARRHTWMGCAALAVTPQELLVQWRRAARRACARPTPTAPAELLALGDDFLRYYCLVHALEGTAAAHALLLR